MKDRPGGSRPRGSGQGPGGLGDLGLGVEQFEDGRARRPRRVAGVVRRLQVLQRPERLAGQQQDDQQLHDAELAVGQVDCPDAHRGCRADADQQRDHADVGDDHGNQPHGVAAERHRPGVQVLAPAAAGVERLERGHALHRVEVLGVQAAVGREPVLVAVVQQAPRQARHDRGDHRAGQHDRPDKRVEHRQVRGHRHSPHGRGNGLREEPPDVRVERLHAVDQGRLHRAGAGALQPARTQRQELGDQTLADGRLDDAGGPQRQRFADGDQQAANHLQRDHAGQQREQRAGGLPREDTAEGPRHQQTLADVGDGGGQEQGDQAREPATGSGSQRQQPDRRAHRRAAGAEVRTSNTALACLSIRLTVA